MNQVDPAWGPRPAKSAFRLWSRYVCQWVWGVPYAVLMVFAPVVNEILNAVHNASGGSRTRPSRRIWLSLDRLRRERSTDVGAVEARLRERFAGVPAAVPQTVGAVRVIQVDDSYFRQIGATRALQIAGEYGWRLPEDTARHAPKWLVLRRDSPPGQEQRHQPQYAAQVSQQVQPVPQAAPQWQAPGAVGPYAPIPAGRHSIRGVIGDSIRLWGTGGQQPDLARVVGSSGPGVVEKGDRTARPPFTVHGGPDGGPLCSVRPAGQGVYDVFAADGLPLARITRSPGRVLLGPRRVRWTVQPSNGMPPVTGRVGTWYSWLTYYVTFPLWALFWLCMVVYTYVSGDADDMRVIGPSRTLWRGEGTGTVMEYRGVNKVYHLDTGHFDVRVAYAQAVLHSRDR